MNYEIKRKFLLKKLPKLRYDSVVSIYQYYLDDDGTWTDRVRRIKNEESEITYLRTRKNRVNNLAIKEDETEITRKEYEKIKKSAKSKVIKKRHVINYGDYKWEIDHFKNVNVILCELEIIANENNLEKITKELSDMNLPDFISNNLIMEVTDFPEFSNKSLSINLC